MSTEYEIESQDRALMDSLTIVRAPHDPKNPYFMMRNDAVQNTSLTYEARGMLAFLLSQKNGRPITARDLYIKGVCGKAKVYSILKELEIACYLKRPEKYQNEKGHWRWKGNYEVYEQPYLRIPNSGLRSTKDISTKDSVPSATSRKSNPYYDAILAVWGHTGSLNGSFEKMLKGISKDKRFTDGNIEGGILPEHIEQWAGWYRATVLRGDKSLTMLSSPMKIQSSIAEWRRLGMPSSESTPRTEQRNEYGSVMSLPASELLKGITLL